MSKYGKVGRRKELESEIENNLSLLTINFEALIQLQGAEYAIKFLMELDVKDILIVILGLKLFKALESSAIPTDVKKALMKYLTQDDEKDGGEGN